MKTPLLDGGDRAVIQVLVEGLGYMNLARQASRTDYKLNQHNTAYAESPGCGIDVRRHLMDNARWRDARTERHHWLIGFLRRRIAIFSRLPRDNAGKREREREKNPDQSQDHAQLHLR